MNSSKLLAIKNAKVVHERGIIWDGVIVIENDRIKAYGKSKDIEIPEGAEIIDAEGAYVGPGFVDIHVHGGGGYSTSQQPIEASEYFLSHGTTTLLPTLAYNMPKETFFSAIETVVAAIGKARTVRGMYLEGPYTNANYGSHSYMNEWRGEILEEDYKRMVDAAGKYATVWTIAPERVSEGLLGFLKYAREVNPNTIFAVGHSEAFPSEIRALGKYRPKIQTHSMNATGRKNEKGHGLRYFGPDEYCFKENDVYCEMISDSLGIHVNTEMQELLIHTKGVDKVVLISDCTTHSHPVPEKYAGVTDLNFDAKGGIAGSKITLDQACRNVMAHTNVGICQAFLMASTNPAKAVGLYDELGAIDIDKRADLVFVDDTFKVKRVILGGETVEKINL